MPLHLLVKWGRWFLQIVVIHVGNFNMKLTGRWFLQIVDRDGGNLYPIYIYNKNCGVIFWTCSREISGDRVALFLIGIQYLLNLLIACLQLIMFTHHLVKISLAICYLPRRRRPGTGDITTPPVRRPSVCLSVRPSVCPSRLVFAL